MAVEGCGHWELGGRRYAAKTGGDQGFRRSVLLGRSRKPFLGNCHAKNLSGSFQENWQALAKPAYLSAWKGTAVPDSNSSQFRPIEAIVSHNMNSG